MDLRNINTRKDNVHKMLTPSPMGENEDTPSNVKNQVAYNNVMTLTPLMKEPEVIDTEISVHIPSLEKKIIDKGKTYEESVNYRFKNIPEVIRRKPNRWLTLCNLQIPVGQIVTGWNQKINQDTVFVQNQTGSAGVLYVASSREDLQGSTIRGKQLSAGDQFTIEVEAGGYFYAPSGATIDLIITWYEKEEE